MRTIEALKAKAELYHFVLSLVVVLGGGYLLATRADLAGEVCTLLGGVLGWWFTKANGVREHGNGDGKGGDSGSLRRAEGVAGKRQRGALDEPAA